MTVRLLRIEWQDREGLRHYLSRTGEVIDEDEIPLILWSKDGRCAEFCEACQEQHWGFSLSPREEEDPQ